MRLNGASDEQLAKYLGVARKTLHNARVKIPTKRMLLMLKIAEDREAAARSPPPKDLKPATLAVLMPAPVVLRESSATFGAKLPTPGKEPTGRLQRLEKMVVELAAEVARLKKELGE